MLVVLGTGTQNWQRTHKLRHQTGRDAKSIRNLCSVLSIVQVYIEMQKVHLTYVVYVYIEMEKYT